MFHGVSSFRRLHTAFLMVLQSGAYAVFPIFHQPCDTTDFVVEGDKGYMFDSEPVVIDLNLIRDFIADKSVYFPAVNSTDETGFKRGYVLITNDSEIRSILDGIPTLRAYGVSEVLENPKVG